MLHGALTLLMRSLRQDARLRRAHAFRIVSLVFLCGMLIVAHVMSFGGRRNNAGHSRVRQDKFQKELAPRSDIELGGPFR